MQQCSFCLQVICQAHDLSLIRIQLGKWEMFGMFDLGFVQLEILKNGCTCVYVSIQIQAALQGNVLVFVLGRACTGFVAHGF